MSEARAELCESIQQTVASLRESTFAIEHLNEAATGLQNASRFKLKA